MSDLSKPDGKVFLSVRLSAHAEVLSKDGACIPLILVTVMRILSDRLEVYFDYFAQCGPDALAAVETYRSSCSNDHKSVYVSRAHYDQTISQINALLKETWERWQVRMQQIIPHYCDLESTDGINHMIYVGESIDSNFPFTTCVVSATNSYALFVTVPEQHSIVKPSTIPNWK